MKRDIRNETGESVGTVAIPDLFASGDVHMASLHQVVVAHLANRRQGTQSTKTRSEVSGSGRKLFRQKGVGRARMGDARSPVRVHGGVAHGPKPRDYRQRTPKKMRRLALISALRDRFRNDGIVIVERIPVEDGRPHTKAIASWLNTLGLADRKVLIVLPESNPVVYLSARNLPKVSVTTSALVHPYEVMAHPVLILLPASLAVLEARLSADDEPAAVEAF